MGILWDYRVVLDLFLGGVSIGIFLLGAVLFYIDSKKYELIIKKSWIIAPIFIIVGLLLLMTELGRPMNVIKTIVYVNPTSFMSIGIFLQGIAILLLLLVALKALGTKMESISKPLVYSAAVFAGLVGFYHGFLLTGIGREPWTNSVPMIFFLSSILAGASISLLISYKSEAFDEAVEKLKIPMIFNAILTLLLVAVFAWAYSLTLNNAEAKISYELLMSNFSSIFWLLTILVGMVLPLILFTMTIMKKIDIKTAFVPAALSIVVGSFFLKYLFVYLGQAV